MRWEDYRTRPPWTGEAPAVPGWVRQLLASLFILGLVVGSSHAPRGLAGQVVRVARYAVESDLTLDTAVAWLKRLPEEVAGLAGRGLDVTVFWRRHLSAEGMTLAWPAQGEVTALFGWQPDQTGPGLVLHKGIDIRVPAGTEVSAVLPGIVSSVRRSQELGLVVEIDHGGGLRTVYDRLGTVLVQENQRVARGDRIGTVDGSGDGSHIHFEVRKDGVEIDPMTVLPPQGKGP